MISTGLDLLMPLKRVRINTRDAPWMTRIVKRQEAFKEYGTDSIQFKFYRNVVNRKRKMCKAKFYETKVEQKQSDPKSWWKEVKRLSGATTEYLEIGGCHSFSKTEASKGDQKGPAAHIAYSLHFKACRGLCCH